MLVLGIETTCDETGAALVREGHQVLSNIVASSADIHEKYGGVFPELACRRHIEAILPVIDEAMKKARVQPEEIDLIAIAKGPGLVGALLIGMQVAKGLSLAWNRPFVGVNHVEAHLYAAMMGKEVTSLFPALGIVLSGGHTLLLKILSIGSYEKIGTTVDDAIGEAFDKVATLLQLPYPGGPPLEQLARQGDPHRFSFQAGQVKKNPHDFSFSGLKTAVLYAVQGKNLSFQERADIAASFQKAAFHDVVKKTKMAAKTFQPRAIFLGGGVCNNLYLRSLMEESFPELPLFFPPAELTLDNAAMIAGLGFHQYGKMRRSDSLDLDVQTRIPIA